MMDAERSHALLRRDIARQPQMLAAGLATARAGAAVIGPTLAGAGRVTLTGSGDSRLVGLVLGELASARCVSWRTVTPEQAVQVTDHTPDDVLIAVSFSGGEGRTVDAVRAARSCGAWTVAVTGAPDGALGRACAHTVPIGPRSLSRSIPHASDFTATLLAVTTMLEAAGDPIPSLDRLAGVVERTIGLQRSVRDRLHADLCAASSIYLLGVGDGHGVATYGAAKLWEAGGYRAWHADPEEFGHGLHLTTRPGDVAIIAVDGLGAQRAADLVGAVGTLGVRPWTLGPAVATDRHLPTVVEDGRLAAYSSVVALQMVCLWMAEARNADVTRPPDVSFDRGPHARYREAVGHPTSLA